MAVTIDVLQGLPVGKRHVLPIWTRAHAIPRGFERSMAAPGGLSKDEWRRSAPLSSSTAGQAVQVDIRFRLEPGGGSLLGHGRMTKPPTAATEARGLSTLRADEELRADDGYLREGSELGDEQALGPIPLAGLQTGAVTFGEWGPGMWGTWSVCCQCQIRNREPRRISSATRVLGNRASCMRLYW